MVIIDFLISRINDNQKNSANIRDIDENLPINIKIELNNAFLKDNNAKGLLDQLPNYIKKNNLTKHKDANISGTKENELKFPLSWLNNLDSQLARVSQQSISLGSLIQDQFSLNIVNWNKLI